MSKPNYDYDLFVIGAGSGGVRAARMASNYGAKVAVAEDRYLGGTCVNVGCVPKKLFVYGSHFAEEFHDASGFGWQVGERQFDWPTLRDNKTQEIERLNGIYRNLLDGAGVTTHWGRAELLDANRVAVDGKEYSCANILIATGGWPTKPDFPGSDLAITSNEAFHLDSFPKDAVVVGGGYIGVEFAGIFHGLGANTSLLYRGDLFLRGFDQGVREFVRDEIAKKGIDLRFNTDVASIEALTDDVNGRKRVHLKNGETLDADLVLYATGRHANTQNIGLDKAGVEMRANGSIVVDDYFQTNVPSVYALGDVIDRVQLTPVAINEGMCLANNLFTDNPKRTMNYNNIATAVFCQPNIGTVGLSEEQAIAEHGEVHVFESSFRAMKHTLTGSEEKTYMKLLVSAADDRVVGAHMVGPDAGEIVQGLGIALVAGLTKTQFDQTVGIHPTTAEEFVTMREVTRTVGVVA